MKNLKHIFCIIAFLLVSSFNSQAQTVDLIANVDVTPPLSNGQTFTYSLMSTGGPYRAIRLNLVYDPSIIQLNSLTPIFPFSFTPVNDTSTPGLIKFEAAYFDSDITENENLIDIEFEILDNSQAITIAHSYNPTLGTVVVNSDGMDVLDSANNITLETLNTELYKPENAVSIYPNPVSDILYIKTENTLNTIEIFTLLGNRVLKTTKSEINVTHFQSGTYLLKIHTELGETIKKLIIN